MEIERRIEALLQSDKDRILIGMFALSSVPGILLQLFLIPLLMERLERANAVHLMENRIF